MCSWSKRVHGFVARFVLLVSSVCGTTGQEVCDGALVSALPPSAFSSSSQLSSSHAPGFARLNRREGAGGWSPLSSDRSQWLQVDLGGRTRVCAVSTQGRYGSSDWLTSYLLMFSDAGHNWKQYRQEDSTGAFPGNTNADSVVHLKLQQPLIARFLRLIPLDWNPNGRIGLRLESYGCRHASDVLSLGTGSSLVFSPGPGPRPTSADVVSLSFKTLGKRGTLLRADGRGGLSLSLELDRGKLQLLVRQDGASSSEARQLASLGSLLDDQQWHHVLLERHGVHLTLSVDKHTEQVQVPAGFSLWDMEELSVGAGQSPDLFHGCLENLLYNHLNLIQLAKHEDPRVAAAGNVTFSCAEPVSVAVTFPGPQSFLQLPGPSAPALDGFSVGFQFRTWNKAGLLLTFDLPQHRGTVWLCLSDARLLLRVQRDGSAELELSAGSVLNDGQWHSVALTSRPGRLRVAVDGDGGGAAHASPSFPVTAAHQLFFGGCPPLPPPPPHDHSADCRNPFGIFQGCMRLLSVDNEAVDLTLVQQRLMGNYSQLQIDMCGMIDRCSPSRCEHGGRCSQTWTVFHCNCSDSGYSGATCHSSVFEPSCEAYKHNGNTSGHFYIDVDGSGPVRPQLVYCNMTEENTWMVIQHNNSELTRLQPTPGENQHLVHFDYSSQEEQLLAAISQSDHCQQELTYRCRRSRLLNTPEGAPFSWWLGGTGSGLQTYWGGAHPGSQQCVCGLRGDCVDPQHYCNCDADRVEWAEDSGLLTHKESLPVRALVLGDIQRPGSEAAYRVGPLRCHGDKNFWNAAFFDKETSYLHFPTFHGELSADISFLFKTTASSGVFLENLGIKDFIRIELSTSNQVTFSFDVGAGPLQVHVASSRPLSDGRWHRVRAERNVKEALLQVDRLPAATQEAPADGHFHLQLNSQLFIGGTASRQKGFRGCIRWLRLNGATLDLEERARMTPGVRPGCPGHCSSYGSFCQNGGRCRERSSGFACDCSRSAHAGAFCHAEVSAGFRSSTSISYTFMRNSSAVSSSVLSDAGEEVSLSFRTSQSPALLLYVSSHYRQYLAVLINARDELEVRYKLDGGREAEVLRSSVGSLANGRLHWVNVRRTDSVSVQVDQNAREDFNLTSDGEFKAIRSLVLGRVYGSDELDPDLSGPASLGFTGCLSGVLFNSISPLKAALLQAPDPDPAPGLGLVVTGPLLRSSCGSAGPADGHAADSAPGLADPSGSVGSGQPQVNTIRTNSALIGGVIAAGIFLLVSGLAVAARFLYRRKETTSRSNGPTARTSGVGRTLAALCENPEQRFM